MAAATQSETTCQGWDNWATWQVKLLLDDGYWHEKAAEIVEEYDGACSAATSVLSEYMSDELWEEMPNTSHPIYESFMVHMFGEVNWNELANWYIEQV